MASKIEESKEGAPEFIDESTMIQEKKMYDWQLYQNGTQMVQKTPGLVYQGTNNEYQMLYSNESFSSGTHYMKLKLDQLSNGTKSFLMIGIIRNGHDYWQMRADSIVGMENGCYACLFNHNYFYEDFYLYRSQSQMKAQAMGIMSYQKNMKNVLKDSDILTVVLDIDNGTFEIQSANMKYVADPQYFTIKNNQWRFAICLHYSNHQIRLVGTKP